MERKNKKAMSQEILNTINHLVALCCQQDDIDVSAEVSSQIVDATADILSKNGFHLAPMNLTSETPNIRINYPAKFVSVWDNDTQIESHATVNLLTREVFYIERVPVDESLEILTNEYIVLGNQSYPVLPRAELDSDNGIVFWYQS